MAGSLPLPDLSAPLSFELDDQQVFFDPATRLLELGPPSALRTLAPPRPAPLELRPAARFAGPPRQLVLLLSPSCNLACTYCSVYQGRHIRGRRPMPDQVVESALDWFFGQQPPGATEPLSLVLFGGEPLLNRRGLATAVTAAERRAGERGLALSILLVTNLTLMTEELARFLTAHRVAVQVSIDGPAAAHDAYRRLPDGRGSHARVMAGLERLTRHLPRDQIMVRPTLTGALSTLEVFAYFYDLGFRKIALIPCDGGTAGVAAEDFAADISRVMERWIEVLRGGGELAVQPFQTYLRRLYDFVGRGRPASYMTCGAGLEMFCVAPEGELYGCHRFAGTPRAEDWTLGTVERGLDHRLATERRATSELGPAGCRACWCHPLCDRGCKLSRQLGADPRRCPVRESWLPRFWQVCLFWYAKLRQDDPDLLLRLVDPARLASSPAPPGADHQPRPAASAGKETKRWNVSPWTGSSTW